MGQVGIWTQASVVKTERTDTDHPASSQWATKPQDKSFLSPASLTQKRIAEHTGLSVLNLVWRGEEKEEMPKNLLIGMLVTSLFVQITTIPVSSRLQITS